MKLKNKTRASSKIGYLVKAVSGGFEYAGLGDTPIGVVTERVSSGAFCEIQTVGTARVWVKGHVSEGDALRMTVSGEGGVAGVAFPVGNEDVYTAVGTALERGAGLISVALNLSSAGVVSGNYLQPGDVNEVPDGGTTGEVLTKDSNADGDYSWQSATSFIGHDITSSTHTDVSLGSALAANDFLFFDGTNWTNKVFNFYNLVSHPTDIAGYGITDAYTKTEVDANFDNYQHWILSVNGEGAPGYWIIGASASGTGSNVFDIVGAGATTVSRSNNVVTISSTDTNSEYTGIAPIRVDTTTTPNEINLDYDTATLDVDTIHSPNTLKVKDGVFFNLSGNTLDNISDGSSYVKMTTAERSKLSGIAAGADAYLHWILSVNGEGSAGYRIIGDASTITPGANIFDIVGGGATTVSRSNNVVTISSTDTNTTYTATNPITLTGVDFGLAYDTATLDIDTTHTPNTLKVKDGVFFVLGGTNDLDDVPDTTNYVRMTPSERTKLSGIDAGADNYQYWVLQEYGESSGAGEHIVSANASAGTGEASTVIFKGSGATSVSRADNTITISSTDTNSEYTGIAPIRIDTSVSPNEINLDYDTATLDVDTIHSPNTLKVKDGVFVSQTSYDTWKSGVTQTEMDYLHGVTSDIQTQFGGKVSIYSTAPASGQLAVWTAGDTIRGYSTLTYNGTYLYVGGSAVVTADSREINKEFLTLTWSDGGTTTWDLDNGFNAEVSVGTSGTTLSISNLEDGDSGTLVISCGASSETITLPSGSKMIENGGSSFTTTADSSAVDILSFIYKGTTLYWTYGQNYK